MAAPRATIIANPYAGAGRAHAIAVKAQAALVSRGIDATLHLPASLDALNAVAAQVCADVSMTDAPTVIACGGDGTIHQVIQHVIPAGAPFGVIPAGTGNDIARALGFKKAGEGLYQQLADSIHRNWVRLIDASRITLDGNSTWSLGVISAGFDSAINERANRMTFGRGTSRYLMALLAELRTFELHNYRVVMDGVPHNGAGLLIAIGNAGNYGGGMRICPEADMTDGLLNITWIEQAPRRTILRLLPTIFSGRHVNHELVHTYTAKEISLASESALIYADGERIGQPPVHIQVMPEAIKVLRGS